MASDDSPASLSFVDLEPIDPAELAPIVVKRFRKSLPLAAASQASGSAAAPPASAQDSPASLRSWSVVVPASTDFARELSFADLQPDASASAPLPGPLDVIARLPVGSRSSFECPVLRDVSDALPRPLLLPRRSLLRHHLLRLCPGLPLHQLLATTKVLLIAWMLLCLRLLWSLPGPLLPGVGLCLSFRPNRQHPMLSAPLRWLVARAPLARQPRPLLCPSLPFVLLRVPWRRNGCRFAAFGAVSCPGCFL